MSFGEAVLLVEQLLLDHGSHLTMSLNEWSYPVTRGELHQMALFEKYVNSHQPEDATPVRLSWPWPDVNAIPEVSDEERAEYRADLALLSAFR